MPVAEGRVPKEFVQQDQRDRILLAGLSVFGAKGFATATVKDLVTEAAVSRETFYKYFADKEACLLALQDEVLGWLEHEASAAAGEVQGWPHAVLAVCELLLGLLVADPRVARLCAIESFQGGERARSRYDAAVAKLASALRAGRGERPWGEQLPGSLEAILVGGAISIAARRAESGDPGPAAAELAEVILIVYLGREDAARIVREST